MSPDKSLSDATRFAAALSCVAAPAFASPVAPPPLSAVTAHYLAGHPQAQTALIAGLEPPASPAPRFTSEAGGTWSLVRAAPATGLCNPVLLTDASVLVASCNTPDWYRLTPDQNGNYATGTWSKMASLPMIGGTQYAPLYHASAVLPDGRFVIAGGEYNGTGTGVWTNLAAILDPVADQWTGVNPPAGKGWTSIGDAQSVVLTSGQWMLGSCCGYPAADALFKPLALGWSKVQAPQFGGAYQDEQGYELLPNGSVLTLDIWTGYPSADSSTTELFDPGTKTWKYAGNTPVVLPDPIQCGTYEIGPAVLRGDGVVVAFGGHTCKVNGSAVDPTATYDTHLKQWDPGPTVPVACGKDGTQACSLADAPAALLPNGNILFAASAGYGRPPTHFFEYGTDFSITQVADPLLHSTGQGAYSYFFLVLPTGQVMASDFSGKLELYTSPGTPVAAWAPKIYHAPANITRGTTYTLSGAQLGGRSAGAYYGDDAQMATNFPIVRIRNVATGHVFYGRTTNFTVSVAPNELGRTKFSIPANAETGPSTLELVANGIASAPQLVTVH